MIDENSCLISTDTHLRQKNYTTGENKYYWRILILIGIYYLLPSFQFIFFQAHDSNVQCHYNLKCKHDWLGIPAFNNIISNIFYVIFGIAFLIIVKLNEKKYTDGVQQKGVNKNISLYYSLGITLVLEGICSSLFHTCPSVLNFQFDTSFMFIGTSLMFLTLYSKRHTILPSPMKFYSFLSCIVFVNILPLSGTSNGNEFWFWFIIYILISYLMIIGSIFVYYGEEYDFDVKSLLIFIKKIKSLKPKDLPKFLLLLAINSFTIGMLIFGGSYKPEFTTWMLFTFLANLLIYYVFYVIQKIKNKEQIGYKIWFALLIDNIILITAMIFFETPVSDKYLTPEESQKLNMPCTLFNYWDYHDIWHIFSAFGLFIFMVISFFLDVNLNNIEYSELVKF